MEKNITYQLNPLIEAQKDFDVMETRLFYLGLHDINPHITEKDKYFDENFPDTIIPPSELKKIFGHGQYIRELDKATDRLIGRYIAIRYEDGFDKYTIFQHVKYKEGKGLFIKFNEDMRPFILDIYKGYKKYGFTRIEMQQIFFLSSAYAMRLLELLLQDKYKAKNGMIERELSIDDLRKKLNVPSEAYKNNMSNFRQFVLDKPIKDINKNTQYIVNYKTVKKGRSVAGIIFFCNCNNAIKDDEYTTTIEAEPTPEERLEQEAGQVKLIEPETAPAQAGRGLTDEQQEAFDSLVNRGIGGNTAEKLAKNYDLARIRRNLKKAVEQKDKAKNLAGLIISFIEQDAAGLEELEKKEARARIEERQKDRRQAYDAFHGTNMSEIGKAGKVEEKEKTEVKELTELTPIEAELIKLRGDKIGKKMLERMKKLGLTIEDVKAGKRKKEL